MAKHISVAFETNVHTNIPLQEVDTPKLILKLVVGEIGIEFRSACPAVTAVRPSFVETREPISPLLNVSVLSQNGV